MRDLAHLAEHLAAGGLVEADGRVDNPNGFKHARHAERGDIAGEDGLIPRGGNEGLGGQIVDLGGADAGQGVDHRALVGQVALQEVEAVAHVLDAFEVLGAGAPEDAVDIVVVIEQEFGQIGAVLARDPGNQRASLLACHRGLDPRVGQIGGRGWSCRPVPLSDGGSGRFENTRPNQTSGRKSTGSSDWARRLSRLWGRDGCPKKRRNMD